MNPIKILLGASLILIPLVTVACGGNSDQPETLNITDSSSVQQNEDPPMLKSAVTKSTSPSSPFRRHSSEEKSFNVRPQKAKSFSVQVLPGTEMVNFALNWNIGTLFDGKMRISIKSPDGKTLTPPFDRGETFFRKMVFRPQTGRWTVTVQNPHDFISPVTATILYTQKDNKAPIGILKATIKNNNTIVFSAKGSIDPEGKKLYYFWDFGDGKTAKGETVSYVYDQEGSYVPTLAISDDKQSNPEVAYDFMTASFIIYKSGQNLGIIKRAKK